MAITDWNVWCVKKSNRMIIQLICSDFGCQPIMQRFDEVLKEFYSSKNMTNLHIFICIDLGYFEFKTHEFRQFTGRIDKQFKEYMKTNPKKYKKVILHPWIQYYRPNQNPFIGFRKLFFKAGTNMRKECKHILIQGERKSRRVDYIKSGRIKMIDTHEWDYKNRCKGVKSHEQDYQGLLGL